MCTKISSIFFFLLALSSSLIPRQSFSQTEKTYGLAALDLQGNGVSEIEAKALSDMLRSSISRIIIEKSEKTKDAYELIERSQMEKIFEQFDIQNTGCTDLSCAIEFGKMLNVDRIIIGSVSLVGSTYMVIARIVDVESSRTIASVDRKQRGVIDNVIDLMPVVGHELLTGERLAAPVPVAPSPVAPVITTPVPNVTQRVESPQEQYISVSGIPEAAEVFLNGEKIGETPIDYLKVNPGRYEVKIIRSGYEDFGDEIVIAPGGNEKISYKLIGIGEISVVGFPEGADVSIDGKEAGETPLENCIVQEGTYKV